jgi:hypothetical protein
VEPDDASSRGDRRDTRGDPLAKAGVTSPEDPAGQDYVGVEPGEVEASDHRRGHRHDLVREPVDDLAGLDVASFRRPEHDR